MKRLAFSMLLATTGMLGCASAKPLGPTGAGEFYIGATEQFISWDGARAAGIEVRGPDGELVWFVTSFATGMNSPVLYGKLPMNATQMRAPSPLEKGKTYKISINLLDTKRASMTYTP